MQRALLAGANSKHIGTDRLTASRLARQSPRRAV
jgi:hypothetical protein